MIFGSLPDLIFPDRSFPKDHFDPVARLLAYFRAYIFPDPYDMTIYVFPFMAQLSTKKSRTF